MVTDTPTQESNISIPKELSFAIPKSLKSTQNSQDTTQKNYQKRDTPEHRNFGYQQLKEDVSLVETKQFTVEKNLRLINQFMPKVSEECNGTAKNVPCNISNPNYTFIDEETQKEYLVGDISFLKKVLNGKLYYELTVDMSYYFHHRENYEFIEENDVVTQTIIWSKDENNIRTKLFFNNQITTSEIFIEYIREENGKKYMKLKEEHIELEENTISSYYLALQKEANKERYDIDSQYATTYTFDSGGREKAIDDAKGFLGEEKGELLFTFAEYEVSLEDDHIISGEKLAGYFSTFDVNGNELSATECQAEEDCDLDDSSTWRNRELN